MTRSLAKSQTAPEGDCRIRLSTQEASFLYSETASGPMHGTSIAVFAGEVPFDAILESFEARLHLVPRYRQRLAFVPFNLAHAYMIDCGGRCASSESSEKRARR